MDTPSPLVARLRHCGGIWSQANDASLARLGRTVVNDGGFFARIEATHSTTTATLEKFARFLIDPAHWPDGTVPDDILEFGHVTGVTGPDALPSPGKTAEFSREVQA